ncbi:MAG TPA: hypothetical protein VF695_11130 [Sphingomonas sp.]|jgi:hypothetical protein
MLSDDELRGVLADAMSSKHWASLVAEGKDDNWGVIKAREALSAMREVGRMVVERCAGVADQLGGDRVERGRTYSDDKHGRGDMIINAQRVRAQTIAAAIRAGEVGRG